ncbi:hypothetical protein ACFXKC_48420 [Streptomyces sp. NPDC059340]|uniref:hypothetical protein n=1 Tax=Streptomyces sp. NPDC059340 TaxID=3346806 RepID=UPI003695FBCE
MFATVHVPTEGPVHRTVDRETVVEGRQGTPTVEPSGVWSPRWAAAIGAVPAHLLATSAGTTGCPSQ